MHLFECPYQSIAYRVGWKYKKYQDNLSLFGILYPCDSYTCKRKFKCDEINNICVTTSHFGNNIKNLKTKNINGEIIVLDYLEKWDIERSL